MKKLSFALLSGVILASCGSNDVSIRSGPQDLHPVTGLPIGTTVSSAETAPSVTTVSSATSDACGAAQYQYIVGQPSKNTLSLNIPGDSRHYGSTERVATNNPNRLNFVHSGTAVEAVTDPNSTVIKVFCG